MKVYLLFSVHEFEGESFIEVYATRKSAEDARNALYKTETYYDYNVYEREVL